MPLPAIALALLLASSPEVLRPEAPPAPSPDLAVRAGHRARVQGAIVLGLSALAGAHAGWSWLDERSYVDFALGDDPGPLIDPTPLMTPTITWLFAGAGGYRFITGTALERGLEPRVPWWYWIGLAPAAASLGAEIGGWGDDAPVARRRVVAFGAIGSAAWFAGATALAVATMPDGAAGADEPAAQAVLVAPMVGSRAAGLALSGTF